MTNPDKARQLFFIDACGAVISAVMLGYVLVHFDTAFGMPEVTLYWLAIIPVFSFFFSCYCFLAMPRKWQQHLKTLAFVNLSYCVLTAVLVYVHFDLLTLLGVGYFLMEMVIIVTLVFAELKSATKAS